MYIDACAAVRQDARVSTAATLVLFQAPGTKLGRVVWPRHAHAVAGAVALRVGLRYEHCIAGPQAALLQVLLPQKHSLRR